jgi:hypothetical protein
LADKHQGPKEGPSTRRRQQKKSSGDKSKKRPTTATFFILFFIFYFFETKPSQANAQEQNPAKFDLTRTNPAKSSKQPARSGLAGPIPGVRRPNRGRETGLATGDPGALVHVRPADL